MDNSLLIDTPYLRRMREMGRTEGRAEGIAVGWAEAIAEVLAIRFDILFRTYSRLEQQLSAVSDVGRLQALLQTAVLASDVATFEQALAG